MKRSSLIFLIILTIAQINAHAQKATGTAQLQTEQIMVVLTDGWASLQGTLYTFEKQQGRWVQRFSNEVVVGSHGLGIGDGVVNLQIDSAPVKQEGDLKAPAGIFTIGTAFGYAPYADAKWVKNPYIKTADTLICVDDMHSTHYNTLLMKDSVPTDYNSFEYMHRKDNYYKWGLFVNHNATKPAPGKGSCIFMHIWENNHTGTEGCTAMTEENILQVLHWIDASKKPLLVQLPKAEYDKLAARYGLPVIAAQ